MKKLLFITLLTIFSALVPLTTVADDIEIDGICYYIDDDEAIVISNDSRPYSGHITIPSSITYNGATYSVTAIGDNSFYGCSNLSKIDIPNSVKVIGNDAFAYCWELTNVEIPSSVEYIGFGAFYNCRELYSVTIPNSIHEISPVAFAYSGLTSIVIPGSVTNIGEEAFAWSRLTSIVIPGSVTNIGEEAFEGCSLEIVKCLGSEPPCTFDYSFDDTNTSNCCFSEWIHRNATLFVPRNSEEAYLTDNCWCMFSHIKSWGSVRPGDVDSDGRLNITDVTVLIDYLLSGNSTGVSMQGADVDQDGLINISDVTALIDKLLGKEQPNEPYETPTPELTVVTDTVAEVVTFTATGEGSIIIYEVFSNRYEVFFNVFYDNDAQAVATGNGEATFEIPFGNWVTEVRVRATAQADDDAQIGIGDLKYVRIPAKQVDPGPDDDSHNTGYWLVMVQDNGAKDYVQLTQGANGDYIYFYDVIYPPYYEIGNFYFMIDGVAYGAPENETEANLGDSMMNPLIANSSNTYYVYSGYSYSIGVHHVIDEVTGEVASYTAYVAKAGPV